jgi:hypothetical protein
VNTKTVQVLILIGIVRGWTLLSKRRTSSHQLCNWDKRRSPLEAGILQRSAGKVPGCEVQEAMDFLSIGQAHDPESVILRILEVIVSTLPSLFFKITDISVRNPARSRVKPNTPKDGTKALPLGPPRKVKEV